jgi:hypothetical protein
VTVIRSLTHELRHIADLDNFHRVGTPIGTHQITLGDDYQVTVLDCFLFLHQVNRFLVGLGVIGMNGGEKNWKYATV